MAEAKQPKVKRTAKPADKPVVETEAESTSWLNANVLWGGLFMLVGLLFLLSNLGVVSIAWGEVWKLWPVAIIIAGLSILKLRGWVAAVVYGSATILIVGLAWVTLTGNLTTKQSAVVSDDFNIDRAGSKVEQAEVNIETGGSELNIASHGGDQLVRGRIESRLADLKHESVVEDGVQTVTLSQQRNWSLFAGGSLNRIEVALGQQLPTSLSIDAGASSIDADLSAVLLKSVSVDSGASSIKLRLGDKLNATDVNIDTGVSSVTIYVPQDSGVKLLLDAGLSSRQLPSDFEDIDEGNYQSADYDAADHKINITVDMGVSSFKIIRY